MALAYTEFFLRPDKSWEQFTSNLYLQSICCHQKKLGEKKVSIGEKVHSITENSYVPTFKPWAPLRETSPQ